MKYTTNQQIELRVEVSEIAEMFCSMDNEQQAEFFNTVAEKSKEWESPFSFQMAQVSRNWRLTEDACKIMKDIGDCVK